MSNTVDVTCKIIPLYRVKIIFEDEKCRREYERHIIADSLRGLMEGIVDAELFENKNFEEEDVRMVFDIQDFLLMPCAGQHGRGYHLFDIDEVDCASTFASIDQPLYPDLRFMNEKNVTGDLRYDHEHAIYAEPTPVSEVQSQPHESTHESHDFDTVADEWKYRDSIMMALYHTAQKSEYRDRQIAATARREVELEAKAQKRIMEVMKEEATRNAGQEDQNA